ncbi:hypothetical protein GCM10028895_26750 [Pontibacter rugosus]
MTLGNSITQGNTDFPGYRYHLWKMLLDEGIDVELVGSHTTNNEGDPAVKGTTYNGKVYTNRNEGHWGWSTDEVLNGRDGQGNLASWLQGYTPDFALIHLGTNDMFKQCEAGESPDKACYQETINELREVIRQIRTKNPAVTILLAQLIPAYANKVGTDAAFNIQELNRRIPVLANELNTDDSPVVVVDQYTGFDPYFDPDNPSNNKDTWDGVHPNTSGELKMARIWYAAIDPAITPQPVELSSFSAHSTLNGYPQLVWTTASETDNAYFEVQRSEDGTSFKAIAQVKGSGTTATAQHYTYTDTTAPARQLYYRLKQVDTDGTSSYSKVVQVQLRERKQSLKVYPTRSGGAPHVTLLLQHNLATAEADIHIYTSEGRLVHQLERVSSSDGQLNTIIPLNRLHGAGLYFVRVTTADKVYNSEFIVEH